jgi:hypothetical protein
MVNYMHVRSSGDLVEIIGERDSLAIICDLSEVHSCNHTCSGYAYEHVQTRKMNSCCENSNCKDCAEEAGYLDIENWHMYLLSFCMTM